MILLDTNVVSAMMRANEHPVVLDWLKCLIAFYQPAFPK